MRPKTISLTGNGSTTSNSAAIRMNTRARPFAVSLGFSTSGSTTAYTVQHTFDDPELVAAASFVWHSHPDMASMTAAEDGNLAFPVTAIRLQANGSGTDTGTLEIVQAGG